jgi:Fe-S oxidoreductase
MSLEEVKEWLFGCTRCGTCKEILKTFEPACPAGERYHLESYFPSGKMAIARGISNGALSLDDDELRERIYACTGCLSCQQQCGVYHHGHIFETVRAVRTEAVTQGLLNPGYIVMIDSLRKDDNVLGKPKAERGEWAKDLDLKNPAAEKTDILYHAGCLLSLDPELWEIPRSALKIMQAAGADVGILGREESCCGGRAYEMGYLGEFTKYAEHFLETGNALGVSRVVTSCSDGYSTFKSLYPQVCHSGLLPVKAVNPSLPSSSPFEGEDKCEGVSINRSLAASHVEMKFEVLHFVEYLDQLLKEGKIQFRSQVPLKVTYHDPCHLGRHLSPGIYDPPRRILKQIPGLELVEMKRIRENAWCCGAGAGVKQADPDFALWTARERLKEAASTGAQALVTACPWCVRNFKDAVHQFGLDTPIYDIAEIAWQSIRTD